MNGDNKTESETMELHMQNPQNVLTIVLCDPVLLHFIGVNSCFLPARVMGHLQSLQLERYFTLQPSYDKLLWTHHIEIVFAPQELGPC